MSASCPRLASKCRVNTEALDPNASLLPPICKNIVLNNFGSSSVLQDPKDLSGTPGDIANLHCSSSDVDVPINAEVTLKEIPFWDVKTTLMKPTIICTVPTERLQVRNFLLHFTPQLVQDLKNCTDLQIQMRICLFNNESEQDDFIPDNMFIKINQSLVIQKLDSTSEPGARRKRPKGPVNITGYLKMTHKTCNELSVTWTPCILSDLYVVALYLVRKLNSPILIRRLKANGIKNPDDTTSIVKELFCRDANSDIKTMGISGSLMCPLGKRKMQLPCRASTCTHLQCFEASLYIQMNELKPKWLCPVCDRPAYFKDLIIDGLLFNITLKTAQECTEVKFHKDGSWSPVMPVKKMAKGDKLDRKTYVPKVAVSKRTFELTTLDRDLCGKKIPKKSEALATGYLLGTKIPITNHSPFLFNFNEIMSSASSSQDIITIE